MDSFEELDAILTEFPLGPFSDIEIYPLTDLHASLKQTKERAQQMARAMQQ